MPSLPTGTVTFLFTDIEGSTRLLHALGPVKYSDALAEHRRVLREVFGRHGGVEVDTQGDSFFVAFPTAPGAASAASEGQRALEPGPLRVRMGLHTGTPTLASEGYVGADVHRGARVAALAHGRQVLLTEATRSLLPYEVEITDLGLHRVKDFDDGVRVLQLGSTPFPPLRTPGAVHLPTPATRFLGRERELFDGVATWLERDPRVLTVIGPGGTGKTRFAIELARLLADEADGATVFVPLAPVRDAGLVLPAIAEHLGSQSAEPGSIAARIGERRTHLLLDNLEHLLPDAAPRIAELIAAAPALRVFVTSREPLRIGGEAELDLPPMDEEDGVGLFLERARAVRPELADSSTVHELVTRLDGLPLALELAAARVRLLTPPELLDRLGQRLDLQGGTRDGDARHATLRATIAWSYDLLDDEERRLFASLAVFRSAFTLSAAENVCGAELDVLDSLLAKSLIRRRADSDGGPSRFWMLETIRQFARERLADQPELEERLHRAHAEWVLGIARESHLSSEDQGRATPEFDRMLAEREEIRAAFTWALPREAVLAAEIFTALEQLWVTSGLAEGRQVSEELLQRAGELPPALHARLLRGSGGIVLLLGERELGEQRYRAAIELFEQTGDDHNARALRARFAVHAGADGDPAEARRLIAEVRRLNEDDRSAMIEAQMLSASGDVARHEGDLETALELYRASVDASATCGFRFWELWQLLEVADLQLELGRTDEAVDTAGAALALATALQDDRIARWTAMTLARALVPSDPAGAGLLWGVVLEEERNEPHVSLDPDFAAYSLPLRDCSEAQFAAGQERGRSMPLGQAVALALGRGDRAQTEP